MRRAVFAWLLLIAPAQAQLSGVSYGGWCYACGAHMPSPHDCVGLRTPSYGGGTRYNTVPPPTGVIPRKSQAQLDAESAREWAVQAKLDMDAFQRSGDDKRLNGALKKLFNAEALLRRPSVYRGKLLGVVNTNIAWCYNEYARLNFKAGQWAQAEKYFRLAWNHNPDAEVYRANIRLAQQKQEEESQAAQAEQTRRQAGEANERGRQFGEQQKWDEAVKAFEDAVRLDPDWQGYRNNLQIAQEKWQQQLAADAARRAAEEEHRQQVAARLEQSRDYTRRQNDLRDAVVSERKQQAAEQIVDVKTPFGTDSYVGAQIPAQGGEEVQTRSAYKQAQTVRDMLRASLKLFQPFAGMGEDTPVEALAQLGYTAQQGSEAMHGGKFRGTVSSEDLPILTPGMPKLRAQMEKVIPVAAQQYKELAETVKVMAVATRKAEEAVQTREITRQEVAQAKKKVAQAEALPEDTEEAKKKKADHSAAAQALLAAATKQEQEAEELKKKAEEERGKAQVELVKTRDALQATQSKLDTLLAGGELPEEKKKGTSEPPPPQIPVKP
ncbi:MAG: hypothetical protein JNM65_06590 [Verrucomicrobiaceae bacterium]|nr:hypothetical protein [Verrucomicrobiaceae bacterium]